MIHIEITTFLYMRSCRECFPIFTTLNTNHKIIICTEFVLKLVDYFLRYRISTKRGPCYVHYLILIPTAMEPFDNISGAEHNVSVPIIY